jgi:protein-tyrosine phosphatase
VNPNRGPRGSPKLGTFEETIDRLGDDRRVGRRVAIHCHQGLGRSPLVAAALLVRSGHSPDAAWNLISQKRRQIVPETGAQREWLRAFARVEGPRG